jgi:hypothetical protein
VRPSTFAIYRAVANGQVLPYIGDKRLQQLHQPTSTNCTAI